MSADDSIAQDLQAAANLDDCQCCAAPADTPIFNRPGLPALAYRVGTYATFFQDMKAQLSQVAAPTAGGRPLAALTTRELDDPTIALLDTAAVLGDILTFYQERIANEGYLRTATERRSVLELARAIGYELNPGVAASTWLAFIVDAPLVPNAALPMPTTIPIPLGQKLQSVPGPNQQPQTFETTAPINACVAWNAMQVRATWRQELAVVNARLYWVAPYTNDYFLCQSLYFAGTQTNIRVGDLLYVSVQKQWALDPVPGLPSGVACVFAANVVVDYTLNRTRVDLDQKPDFTPVFYMPPQPQGAVSLTPRALTYATVEKLIVAQDWDEADLRAYIAIQKWDPDQLLRLVATVLTSAPPPADVYAFRTKTAMAGSNAPPFVTVDTQYQAQGTTNPWSNWDSPANDIFGYSEWDPKVWYDYFGLDVFLDRVVPLRAGSIVAFSSVAIDPPVPYVVAGVADASLVAFGMSAKSTGLRLANTWNHAAPFTHDYGSYLPNLRMRTTNAYVQSEPVALTDAPIPETVGNVELTTAQLVLDRMVLGLTAGQKVAVSGTVAQAGGVSSGVQVTELAELQRIVHSRGYTILIFAQRLQYPYVRSSITINANVAPATHGETVATEILGSGDATQKNQRFTLSRAPMTYVVAPTASGGQDTLTVRVDGVAWTEVPTLWGAGPNDTVYTVRLGDDGSTVIRFGDGTVGARLPSGNNNVVADYRAGLGPAGNIDAGSIAILAARPYGLKSGVNPVSASGGAAAEQLADARQNAPRTVRTLERVVSLDDFADFARGFAGVGKALAVPLWSGERQIVHITVAGSNGEAIDPKSAQWSNLVAGIFAAGDVAHLVQVGNFVQAYFNLTARIIVDARYDLPTVMAQVAAALRQSFAFAARDLAQTVTESEAIGFAQSVPGVIAVEVTALYRADGPPGVAGTLPANGAHFVNGAIVPAELLLLHPVGLSLTGSNP